MNSTEDRPYPEPGEAAARDFLARFAADNPSADLALAAEFFAQSLSPWTAPTHTAHESFDSEDPALKAHNRRAAEEDHQMLAAAAAADPDDAWLHHAAETAAAAVDTYSDDPYAAEAARCEVRHLDDMRRAWVSYPATTPRAVSATSRARPRSRARRRRRLGARRTSGSRGDPPGGSEDDDPAGPERLCECGCGRSIAHKRAGAKTATPACRKRLERHGYEPIPREADAYYGLTTAELEALKQRAHGGCLCSGQPILDPHDGACVKCGHPYDEGLWRRTARERLIQARSLECRQPRPQAVAA